MKNSSIQIKNLIVDQQEFLVIADLVIKRPFVIASRDLGSQYNDQKERPVSIRWKSVLFKTIICTEVTVFAKYISIVCIWTRNFASISIQSISIITCFSAFSFVSVMARFNLTRLWFKSGPLWSENAKVDCYAYCLKYSIQAKDFAWKAPIDETKPAIPI